jgi:glycosyltransferase involved in cell wall biosynthesis
MKNKCILIGPAPDEMGGISTFIKNVLELGKGGYINFSNSRKLNSSIKNKKLASTVKFIKGLKNYLLYLSFLLKNSSCCKSAMVVTPSGAAFFDSIVYIMISRLAGHKAYLRYAGDFIAFYSSSSMRQKYLISKALNTCSKVIVQSQGLKDYLVATVGFNSNKVEVLPEVIMEAQTEPNAMAESINILFFGGSEAKRKGSTEVVEAIDILNKTKNIFKFHLVALPDDQLESMKKKNYGNVVCYSRISGNEKKELMKQMSVLLLPSYKEGMPNAILDAISYGMAIITTKVGSIPEVLTEEINTQFVRAGRADELVEAIEKTKGAAYLEKMMKNNFQLSTKYSKDSFLETLNAII